MVTAQPCISLPQMQTAARPTWMPNSCARVEALSNTHLMCSSSSASKVSPGRSCSHSMSLAYSMQWAGDLQAFKCRFAALCIT